MRLLPIRESDTRNDTSGKNRGGLEAVNQPLARMFSGGEEEDRTPDRRIANTIVSNGDSSASLTALGQKPWV